MITDAITPRPPTPLINELAGPTPPGAPTYVAPGTPAAATVMPLGMPLPPVPTEPEPTPTDPMDPTTNGTTTAPLTKDELQRMWAEIEKMFDMRNLMDW